MNDRLRKTVTANKGTATIYTGLKKRQYNSYDQYG